MGIVADRQPALRIQPNHDGDMGHVPGQLVMVSGNKEEQLTFGHCPSVSVVIAGYNEAGTVGATLASLWGTYPRLEVIVVDDGSEDDMAEVAESLLTATSGSGLPAAAGRRAVGTQFRPGIRHGRGCRLRRCRLASGDRGDSTGIVQPLQDPRVGAASAAVLARNPFTNLATWFQAYEYLNTIFVGGRSWPAWASWASFPELSVPIVARCWTEAAERTWNLPRILTWPCEHARQVTRSPLFRPPSASLTCRTWSAFLSDNGCVGKKAACVLHLPQTH